MSILLAFHAESSNIPDWPAKSDEPHQPHIVRLAAVLIDDKTQDVLDSMDVVVVQDGWESTPESFEVHGITKPYSEGFGIPEAEAIEMFISLWLKCDMRVAHNTTFDNRIIRIGLLRFFPGLVEDDDWKDKSRYFSTMLKGKKIMGGKSGHTLPEVYKHFIGKDLEGEHDTMIHTEACAKIYYAIKALE